MTNPHDLKGLVDRIRHSGVMHTSDDWTVELRLGGLRIACADPSPECAKTLGDVVRVWSAAQSGSLVPVERVRELEAENERLRARIAELEADAEIYIELERENAVYRDGVLSVDLLTKESDGVYGLHLNDEPAPWESLMVGGHEEEWLAAFERAAKLAHSDESTSWKLRELELEADAPRALKGDT